MSITTMEELEAIASGDTITVGGQEARAVWTRIRDGLWQNNNNPSVQIRSNFFLGSVQAGVVVRGDAVPMHQRLVTGYSYRHLQDGVNYVTVCRLNPDDPSRGFLIFHDGNGMPTRMDPDGQLSEEEWGRRDRWSFTNPITYVGSWLAENDSNLNGRMATVVSRLHAFAADLDTDVRDEYDSMLESIDLPREETVTSIVTVEGTTTLTMDASTVFNGNGEVVSDFEAQEWTSPWTAKVQVTRNVRPGTCVCETVTDDEVGALVPQPNNGWEVKATSCPNCS